MKRGRGFVLGFLMGVNGQKNGPGYHAQPRLPCTHIEADSRASFSIYPVPAKIRKQSGTRPSHTPL